MILSLPRHDELEHATLISSRSTRHTVQCIGKIMRGRYGRLMRPKRSCCILFSSRITAMLRTFQTPSRSCMTMYRGDAPPTVFTHSSCLYGLEGGISRRDPSSVLWLCSKHWLSALAVRTGDACYRASFGKCALACVDDRVIRGRPLTVGAIVVRSDYGAAARLATRPVVLNQSHVGFGRLR